MVVQRDMDSGRKGSPVRTVRIAGSKKNPASKNTLVTDPRKDHTPHPYLLDSPPAPERTQQYCHKLSEWAMDNLNVPGVLMTTVHGSYLYGTAHSGSDIDVYVVAESGKNKSLVVSGVDVQIFTMETFAKLVAGGSHQAVEALYSPYAVWDEESPYYWYLRAIRPSMAEFAEKCNRAAKSYRGKALEDPIKATKYLRHAERLEQSVEKLFTDNYSPVYQDFQDL